MPEVADGMRGEDVGDEATRLVAKTNDRLREAIDADLTWPRSSASSIRSITPAPANGRRTWTSNSAWAC
jgi:hypothetical protein